MKNRAHRYVPGSKLATIFLEDHCRVLHVKRSESATFATSKRSCARYDSRELARVRSYIRILRESLPLPSRKSFPSMHGMPLQHFFAFRSLLFAWISCTADRSIPLDRDRSRSMTLRILPDDESFPLSDFPSDENERFPDIMFPRQASARTARTSIFRDSSRWNTFRVSTRPNASYTSRHNRRSFSLRVAMSPTSKPTLWFLLSDKGNTRHVSIYMVVIVFHGNEKKIIKIAFIARSLDEHRKKRRSDRTSSRWVWSISISMYRAADYKIDPICLKSTRWPRNYRVKIIRSYFQWLDNNTLI